MSWRDLNNERLIDMSLEEWLSSHSSSPSPFCFACAFLPEPHALCVVHSLQQQQRDAFGLEDGRESESDVGGEGKDEEGPLPILHSTPQAGAAQVDCFTTPDLLTPGHKSTHDEVPLALAWSGSMATPPLQWTGRSTSLVSHAVGRTTERRFLLETNVSTDVSTLSHSLLDEEIFVNTKHKPLDGKPDDGTPRRGDIGTSPDRRKLVALFNIRGGQLEGEVSSPTSPPFLLGQPEKEGIVAPDGASQEGPSQTSKLRHCNDSSLSNCQQTASSSPMAPITSPPHVYTPLNHEPSLRDSSFADCMIGSQDLFYSSPEPAISPTTPAPDSLPCTGDGRRNERCSPQSAPHEPVDETGTVTGFDVKCDDVATLCQDATPVDDYPCTQEVSSNTLRETSSTLCSSPPVPVEASSEVAVATGGTPSRGIPMEGDQDGGTFCNQEQNNALCVATSLCSVQTCDPFPLSTSAVAKQTTRKRPSAAKFLYPSKHQRTRIKQLSLADSNDPNAASSSVSALAQSVLTARKNIEHGRDIHLPVDESQVFHNHRLASGGETPSDGGGGVSLGSHGNVYEESSHHDSPGSVDKEEGQVLQLGKEFPVTCSNSLPSGNSVTAPHTSGTQQQSEEAQQLCEQEDLLCQDNGSQVLRGSVGVAGSSASSIPDEQCNVHISREAVSVSQDKLLMNAGGRAEGDKNVCKVLPPARKRKRPSRSRWARRRKKRKEETDDLDKEDAAVCVDPPEKSELESKETGVNMAENNVEQTFSSVNEGEEGVNLVDSGGNAAEEGVQLEAMVMECKETSDNPKHLDSIKPSVSQDVKPPDQRILSTVDCVESRDSQSQHAAADGTGESEGYRAVIAPTASGVEDSGASKLLPQQAGSVSHLQKSSITDGAPVLRKQLPGRVGSEPRVQGAAVSRGPTKGGFKAPRLAASVPLAEENAARTKLLRGFGVMENIPAKSALSMTGAQQLHSTSRELPGESDTHTPLAVEGCGVQRDMGRVEVMDTRVKDSCSGVALTGFSTASGAKCTVPNSALDRVKPLLMAEDRAELPGMPSHGSVQAGTGFSTASGRKCTVTSASLRKAETIVKDTMEGISPSGPMDSMFTGFSTAGGRKCTVSAGALKRAETLCDEPSLTATSDDPAVSGSPRTLTGFTTASGGACSVSASALSMGQRLCSEDAVEMEGHTEPAHAGFSTAGGSRITVSGGALCRVKQIFTDLMNEGDVIPSEVQPTGISGSMVDSTKDLDFAAVDNHSGEEGVMGDCARSKPEGVEGQGQFGESVTDVNLEVQIDAKDKFVGNSMDTSLPGGQEVEVDLQGIDLDAFAAFTQLPQQNASRETTDAEILDRLTVVSLLATDRQSDNEDSHVAIDDTLIPEVDCFAVGCHGEEEKESVSTSSTVSLEGSSVYEHPYLDTQMVQQMLESTAISTTGADDPTGGRELAENGASFNLTISLANLGEGFSQLGPNDSVMDDDAIVTSSPHPDIKLLEETKEVEGTGSLDMQLHEECFSLTQFEKSLSLPAIAEGMCDSSTLYDGHAQSRAVVDGGGGTGDEDQGAVTEEEGEMMVDARGGVATEERVETAVDEKEVTMLEERKDTALDIQGRLMVEEGREELMEEREFEVMVLEGEAVVDKEKVTMEGEGVSAIEVGGRYPEIGQLTEDMCPTMTQEDTFIPDAVKHPTVALSFPGLQTASGKEVTVSRAALDKVRSIISPATLLPHRPFCTKQSTNAAGDACFKEPNSSGTSPKLREKAMFVGLQTASGKSVPISSEAMEHVSAQHRQPRAHGGGEDGVGGADTGQPATGFQGLQTASGKAVTVSEAALKTVRSLTHEPHASTGVVSGVEQEGSCCSSSPIEHFVGLQTASGKKVEVAEESLEHVRSSNGSCSTALHSFTTAGGKVTSISEGALHHVRSNLGGTSGGPGFPGLQTAGGIPVEVSEESLAHVRAERGRMGGDSPQQIAGGLSMGTTEDRQVEVSTESLQKVRAVPMASSGSSVLEREQCDRVPPVLPLDSSSLRDSERAQRGRAAEGVPPSSAKNRCQPLQPAVSALSSAREVGVPSVVKYAPRFKPQTSTGSKSTIPKKTVDESRTTLAAPAAFQSPPTASFKPSYHSTPEAFLTDRHRGLGGTPLKPLRSTAMETPTNHQRGQPCGATPSTGQRKRFVYSVPPRGRLPTTIGLPHSVQPQPICTREDGGGSSLLISRVGLTRTNSFNSTPVWPAGLRRPQGHRPALLAASTPKQPCKSSLHGTRASYPTATSLPLERARLKDSDQRTIAVRLNLDESCPNETLPEAITPCEAMSEGTSPAVVPYSPQQPQERFARQAQTPDVLHGEAVDDADDLTDSQLTLFMNMTQLEQPPPTAATVTTADTHTSPVSTSDRQHPSEQQEGLQTTNRPTSPSCSTVQSTTLSPEPDIAMKGGKRDSISPVGNVTSFMFEDSGIGTMPTSNNTSVRPTSCLAPSPNCTTHPEPFTEECSNTVAQPKETQQHVSLQGMKRAGECQSEPRASKRRKDDHDKPLNNTFMDVTTIRGVGRGCPIRPQGGTLYSIKRSSGRRLQPLSQLTQGLPPRRHTEHQLLALGVPSFVLGVSITNAAEFRFEGRLFFSTSVLSGQGVRVGDGAMLHLGEDGCAGACELERAFCTTPGVDPRLVPAHWFRNHYKWLVWKLAAMEVCFPLHLAGRCLTPNWLMTQMKYRYDKEIDNAQRSALRKIYEHDDTPAKTMVLCVCKVTSLSPEKTGNASNKEGNTAAVDETVVELTDGWYSIPAVFDSVLKYYLRQGTISIGTKLITCGAELAGSGEPCSPLEAPSSVMLKVSANSTRRALWDTKLGFYPHAKPFHIPIHSVRSDGGKVGCTSFTVARVYPLLCMEKRADGSKAFRTKRAEEKAARASDSKRQRIIEGICERERKQFEKEVQQEDAGSRPFRSRRRLNSRQIMGLDDGEDIYQAMHQAADPLSFQECLSVTQKTLLMSYKETVDARRRDELQRIISSAIEEAEEEELPPQRDVVPFLKMKVTETYSDMGRTPSDAVFCVWRPSEDVRQLLKEGCSYRVYTLQASEGRGGLQLTATKFTRYEEVPSAQSGRHLANFCPRQVTAISDLTEGSQDHPYGEVDMVGLVIHVSSTVMATARGEVPLDNIYLADEDGHMVTVKVWEGLSALGYDDLVQPCMLLSASNLLVQQHSTGRSALPSLQARDISVFSQSPRDQHLSDALRHLKGALPAKVKAFCDSMLEYVRF